MTTRLTLMGMSTMPHYNDSDQWIGATISADIEAETSEPDGKTWHHLHRCGINIEVSPTLAKSCTDFGCYDEISERFIMKRAEAAIGSARRRFPGTDKDCDTIYEVMRLKMPRFLRKSVERVCYSQSMTTGEVFESNVRI